MKAAEKFEKYLCTLSKLCILSEKDQIYIREVRDYALSKGMKEKNVGKVFEYSGFRYTYNEKISLKFHGNPLNIAVSYNIASSPTPFDVFMQIVESQPDSKALCEFISKNIHTCDGCAVNAATRAREKEYKKCGFFWVEICGQNRIACDVRTITTWQFNRHIHELCDDDTKMLKRLIDIRIEQIDKYDTE